MRCGLFRFGSGKFHQIRFDEIVDIAIHHGIDIGCLEIGTVVFHAAIIEYIASNL